MGPGAVGPPYTDADIRRLSDWGANYVNISYPGIFAEKPNAQGEYYEQQGIFDNLLRLINICRNLNLFVVVSFRTGPERSEYVFDKEEKPKYTGIWKNRKAQQAWANMWALTASRLRNQVNVVGYDLMVEPGLEPEGNHRETWNRMAEQIRIEIRRAGAGNDQATPILIGPSGGSSVDSLDEPVPPADPRTVYTVHQYVPDEYAQPESGQKPITYPGGIRQMVPDLQSLYGRITIFKTSQGNIPIAVNEFGAVRFADRAECYINLQTELLERLGSNYALWLWETSWPLSYDEFNFKFGPDRAHHAEVESSELITVIRGAWARNGRDLSQAMERFSVHWDSRMGTNRTSRGPLRKHNPFQRTLAGGSFSTHNMGQG
ncbi:MAG: hypothetical protein QOH41_2486 [Blastocatellia bacterium]|jgi:hypothetical protein|nr:hypothetical protein [Blastocatellia bacterium]